MTVPSTGVKMSTTAPITIYGASDDLLEVEGAVNDEFDASGPTRVRLTAPDGDSLDVVAEFSRPGDYALDWTITVETARAYPAWPIRFHERPGYEGDPGVTIDAPAGTTVELIEVDR
jgi:hypothetical protein